MDELVNTVASKTGLSHDQAQAAATAVIEYLKSKLPGPVAGQIDSVLGGGGNLGDMAKGLGGMFGKKA
jgi:hypothetical protein